MTMSIEKPLLPSGILVVISPMARSAIHSLKTSSSAPAYSSRSVSK